MIGQKSLTNILHSRKLLPKVAPRRAPVFFSATVKAGKPPVKSKINPFIPNATIRASNGNAKGEYSAIYIDVRKKELLWEEQADKPESSKLPKKDVFKRGDFTVSKNDSLKPMLASLSATIVGAAAAAAYLFIPAATAAAVTTAVSAAASSVMATATTLLLAPLAPVVIAGAAALGVFAAAVILLAKYGPKPAPAIGEAEKAKPPRPQNYRFQARAAEFKELDLVTNPENTLTFLHGYVHGYFSLTPFEAKALYSRLVELSGKNSPLQEKNKVLSSALRKAQVAVLTPAPRSMKNNNKKGSREKRGEGKPFPEITFSPEEEKLLDVEIKKALAKEGGKALNSSVSLDLTREEEAEILREVGNTSNLILANALSAPPIPVQAGRKEAKSFSPGRSSTVKKQGEASPLITGRDLTLFISSTNPSNTSRQELVDKINEKGTAALDPSQKIGAVKGRLKLVLTNEALLRKIGGKNSALADATEKAIRRLEFDLNAKAHNLSSLG